MGEEGSTALHVAAIFAGTEFRARTLTLLLQTGANPLIKNRNGMTARKLMELSNAHDWAGIGVLRNEEAKAQLTRRRMREKKKRRRRTWCLRIQTTRERRRRWRRKRRGRPSICGFRSR